jgi:hypothetical protein
MRAVEEDAFVMIEKGNEEEKKDGFEEEAT